MLFASGPLCAGVGLQTPAAFPIAQGVHRGVNTLSPAAAAAMAAFTGASPTLPAPTLVPEPGSRADLMQKLTAELSRLQIKVKEKRQREAAAMAAAAAYDEAAMLAKLMAEIGELKKELGEE